MVCGDEGCARHVLSHPFLAARHGRLGEDVSLLAVAPQQVRAIENAERAVQMLTNQNPALCHAEAECLRLDLQRQPANLHRVIVTDNSVLLVGKDLAQILRTGQRNKRGS